jgi:hypothetical protein
MRPGNRTWGKPMPPSQAAPQPTEFELAQARCTPEQLKAWAKAHWRSRYVPEELLLDWGIASKFDLEGLE